MNASIRKVAFALGLVFLTLFASLNYVQLARSEELSKDPRNRRRDVADARVKRGEILGPDGRVLARSVSSGHDTYIWRRQYPLGGLFGHITGYHTFRFFCDRSALEATQDDYLTGREPQTPQDFMDELLGKRRDGNRIQITIDPRLQEVARKALGKQRGGAALIDVETGAVYALFGNPTYDPNLVTQERLGECAKALDRLESNPAKPLLSRAYQVPYPPGSTFKIVTAAAGLELGKMTTSTSFRTARRIDLPDTDRTLGNFGNSSCGGTMVNAMRVSCNTYFALLGLRIGADKLVTMAERFGLNDRLGSDLRETPSCVRLRGGGCSDEKLARPFVAYSSIGQFEVRITPLQMASISATVANGGYVVRPYVVQKVIDPETNDVLVETEPQRSKRIYSKRTADSMRSLMTAVVRSGTGRVVGFSRRYTIGGKTGTAQTGDGKPPHVWFTAWGGRYAVAVVVENGGDMRNEATGGRVAGPIAKALLEYALTNKIGAK